MVGCRVVGVEKIGQGPNLLMTLRGEDGNRYIHYEKNFRPYFWVEADPDDTPHCRSLDNIPLRKMRCDNVQQLVSKRKDFDVSWEADVPYPQRYMVDKGIFGYTDEKGNPIQEHPTVTLKKLYIDIETAEPTKQKALDTKETARIVGISAFDGREVWTFAYTDARRSREEIIETPVTYGMLKGKEGDDEPLHFPWHLEEFETEEEQLRAWWAFIAEYDPDLIVGYNSAKFDWPMLVNRSKKKHVSTRKASVLGYAGEFTCPGRQLVDAWQIYIWTLLQKERDTSLGALAKKHGMKVDKSMQANVFEAWTSGNYDDLNRYNAIDVVTTWFVDQRERLTSFALSLQEVTGVDEIMDVTKASVVADVLCLREAHKMAQPLPSRDTEDNEEYGGGSVLDPLMGGRLENVEVFDFSRLYPSIIISLNISPETLVDGSKFDWPEIPGLRDYLANLQAKNPKKRYEYPICYEFKKQPKGLLPRVVEYAFELRDMCERNRDKALDEGHKEESEQWAMRAQATKKIINGIYGALGYKNFRLYTRELAESVTGSARYIINMLVHLLREEHGLNVVYGDTDSVFILGDGNDREKITEAVKQAVASASEMMGIEKPMKIDHEKTYWSLLIVPGKKKRYAGYIMYKDGRWLPEPKYEVKGWDEKRSDSAVVTAKVQHNTFDLILRNRPREEILEYVLNEIRAVAAAKYPPEEVVRMPSLSKPLKEIHENNQARRCCEYANQYYKAGFEKGDRALLLYVKSWPSDVPKPPGGIPAIAVKPNEPIPEGFEVDWEVMSNKAIGHKFSKLFKAIGWQHESVRCASPFNNTLESFGLSISAGSFEYDDEEDDELEGDT